MGDGLGEVVVPASPLVDGLGPGHAETLGDLRRTDEVLGIDAAAHVLDAREALVLSKGFLVYGCTRWHHHALRVQPYTTNTKGNP